MPSAASGLEKHRFDIGLEDLQTFIAVAEGGSFSRAAERMNLSQPSISNRVRRLEEKLHVRLLNRTTRSVELTPTGRRLYLRASETLRVLRDLLQELESETTSRAHHVAVGATMMVASVALPPALRAFQTDHPAISVSISDLAPREAVKRVIDGRCDLAVMSMHEPQPGVVFEPLFRDRCVVVTPRNHPLVERGSATLAEVLANPILSPNGHVELRGVIQAEADARGLRVRIAPEGRGVGNTFTLLAMAAAGLGVCIQPRAFIPTELEPTIGIVPLADVEIIRTFGLVTSEMRASSPAVRRFCDFLRVFFREGPPAAAPTAGPGEDP